MSTLAQVLQERATAAAKRALALAARHGGEGGLTREVEIEESLEDLDRYSALLDRITRHAGDFGPYSSGRHSFLADLVERDRQADERLDLAGAERRDIGFANALGSAIPISLLSAISEYARGGRPLLERISAPMPDGVGNQLRPLTVTAAVTAGAIAEGSAIGASDLAVTNGTALTITMVGARTRASRVLFQRTPSAAFDAVVLGELAAATDAECDRLALTGTGTGAEPRGLLNVAGTNAITIATATTGQDLLTKIAAGVTQSSAGSKQPADLTVMHSRRAAWFGSRADTMLLPSLPRGVLTTDLVVDDNLATNLGGGTNEDRVIVLRSRDVGWYETPLMVAVLEQTPSTAPGQVDIAVFRMVAGDFGRRPTSISVLSGAGLAVVAS